MKRIITCSDGTWNKPSVTQKGKPIRTNVQKIFDLICKRDDQNILQIKLLSGRLTLTTATHQSLICSWIRTTKFFNN